MTELEKVLSGQPYNNQNTEAVECQTGRTKSVHTTADHRLDDWFIEKYLAHDGESIEDARMRLEQEQLAAQRKT